MFILDVKRVKKQKQTNTNKIIKKQNKQNNKQNKQTHTKDKKNPKHKISKIKTNLDISCYKIELNSILKNISNVQPRKENMKKVRKT